TYAKGKIAIGVRWPRSGNGTSVGRSREPPDFSASVALCVACHALARSFYISMSSFHERERYAFLVVLDQSSQFWTKSSSLEISRPRKIVPPGVAGCLHASCRRCRAPRSQRKGGNDGEAGGHDDEEAAVDHALGRIRHADVREGPPWARVGDRLRGRHPGRRRQPG